MMGGNKRQRLARKKFRMVTGGGQQDSESRNVTGVSENGSKQGKKKKPPGKKRKANQVNGVSDAAHQSFPVGPEHVANESEFPQGKFDAALSSGVNCEAKVLGENGAPKQDEKPARNKKPGRKHPLRISGMKPGDGCFICKGTDHIAKLCPTKNERDRKKICLFCRAIGHSLKNCPTGFESQEAKFCYNCGENGHRLAKCRTPLKNGGTVFTECFICKKKGHLSKSCPTNPHGIYPKGGRCKICGGLTHLARDCPTKKAKKAGGHTKLKISPATTQVSGSSGFGKRTVFKSGDDLGDDFVSHDEEGDTIVGALSFGSDYDAPESGCKAGPTKSTPKLNNTKKEKGLAQVIPISVGSTKVLHAPNVIKFQRPQEVGQL